MSWRRKERGQGCGCFCVRKFELLHDSDYTQSLWLQGGMGTCVFEFAGPFLPLVFAGFCS